MRHSIGGLPTLTASHASPRLRYERAPSPLATSLVDNPAASTAAEPAKTACGPRVGVLLWADEQGPANISGMPWSMREALGRAGCRVEPVLIGDRRRLSGAERGRLPYLHQLRAGVRTFCEDVLPMRAYRQLESFARDAARRAELATKGLELDVVFAPLMSAALAFYEGPLPVVYATDSTASLLHGSYHAFGRRGEGWKSAELDLETRAIARADRVVVATEHVRQSAIRHHGAAAQRVAVVPMGANLCPLSVPSAAATPPTREDLRLLLTARDPERKRLNLGVQVVQELRQRGWSAVLHYVGPRRAECARPEVCWEGYLSHSNAADVEQHRRLLRDCHVALLPSAAEMYGIAPIESAAFGRPAVVSDAGGLPTVVLDRLSGRVVAVDASVSTWADAVEHVAAEPARYAAYARAARSRYEHTLNWDAWGRRVREVLEQVI